MPNRIEKPEPPPPYYVKSAAETRKDKDREGGTQREFDEYSGSHAAPGWQKIYASSANRRYIKLRREDLVRAWFRGTAMQRGVSLVEADLELKGQKILHGAHVILPTREDFWTLKKFQPGQDLPLNMIARDPILEISIPAPKIGDTQQIVVRGPKAPKAKRDHSKLIIYGAAGIVVLIILMLLFRR